MCISRLRLLLACIATALLVLLPFAHVKAGGLGDTCYAWNPCDAGLTCHPFLQKCYNSPRAEGQPCSLGFGCGGGLTCEAGSQVCVGPQDHGGACHLTRQCAEGLSCQPGVQRCYNSPRTVGEPCSAGFACSEGLTCYAGIQKCFPDNFEPSDRNACFALYDAATANTANNSDITTTYGYGFSASGLAPGGSTEVGVVYGNEGQYGCYLSTCGGFGFDLSISGFFSIGQYRSFDSVAGESEVYSVGGSVPVIELGGSVGYVQTKSSPKEPLGSVQVFSMGLGVNPLDLGSLICTTTVNEINIQAMQVELGIIPSEWIAVSPLFKNILIGLEGAGVEATKQQYQEFCKSTCFSTGRGRGPSYSQLYDYRVNGTNLQCHCLR